MIQVHKEQAKLVNAQSHLYETTRLNMRVTKHNNVDQTFWIFYFLCVFGFLTQSKWRLIKNNKHSKLFKQQQQQQQKNSKNMLE